MSKPKTKHSPGPWGHNGLGVIHDANGHFVCTVDNDEGQPPDNWPDNARLIETGPDMLAVLRDVYSLHCGSLHGEIHPHWSIQTRRTLEAVKALIVQT